MDRTSALQEAIDAFLSPAFPKGFSPQPIGKEESALIASIVENVKTQFHPITYVLGLALDFTILAQRLSHFDSEAESFRPGLVDEELFSRYELVTSRGKKQVNTLTFRYAGKPFGIRKIEEAVCDLFVKADRTGYPSAYVYNTGMWHHYRELLVDCFKLSESGRFFLCNALIDFGLESFPKNVYFGRSAPRVRLFGLVLDEYLRSHPDENAGMVYQGIAYGYLKSDRPHLSLIVDKVRTGSARQRRFGDIDGYFGLDLEVSAEVKDHPIDAHNVESELGQFLRDVSVHGVQGLVFAPSVDQTAEAFLRGGGVFSISEAELTENVAKWDWRKQDAALNGLLHFVSHVEQNPKAVRRLLDFIKSRDPGHDSLAYFSERESE